ncbi:MAG: MFS transporter [Acetobacteraceae bacterium]|nr:MFS transporter [Acetobacteraceae bacterium]
MPADGLPQPARGYAMVTLCMAVAMAVLDGAIANIALPTIATDLHTSPAASIWVVNAYQLAVTVSLLPFSSLGDIYGYRRVFIAGLSVFTAASLACALSHSLPALVASRVVQGFGAAGVMSVNTALVRFVVPRVQLGRGMARITLTVAASAATGPTVAAGILSVAPWPYLFAINLPIGVVAILLALRSLPHTPLSQHAFDVPSALLNAATFGLLIIAVDGLGQGETPLAAALEFAGSVAIGVVFIRKQLTLPAPMLPVDLFRRPIFALSVATSICSYSAQALAYVGLPFLFQYAGGLSQIETGLLMTPWPFVVVFVAPLAGRLSDRYSAGLLGGIGLAVLTLGLLLLFMVPEGAPNIAIAWRMAVCGIGFGFFQTPNNRAILSSAPRERSGASSGMLATARLLGQTGGAALVALIFGLTGGHPGGVGYGAKLALAVGAGFSAAGAIASLARLGRGVH